MRHLPLSVQYLAALLWQHALPLQRECRGSFLTRKGSDVPPSHAWASQLATKFRVQTGEFVQYLPAPTVNTGQQATICNRVETTSPSTFLSDWGYCADRWQPRLGECLVISIGLGGNLLFEEAMAAKGCVVHAFDPTLELRAAHESLQLRLASRYRGEERFGSVRFHFAGLGGAKQRELRSGYGTIGGPIESLKDLLHCAKMFGLALLMRLGAAPWAGQLVGSEAQANVAVLIVMAILGALPKPTKPCVVGGMLLARALGELTSQDALIFYGNAFVAQLSQGVAHDVSLQPATLLSHEEDEGHGRAIKLAFEWSHVAYFPNLLFHSVHDSIVGTGKKGKKRA